MVTRSSHSISMCPPHSPTRITKKSILKFSGAFHWPKTSRIRFWAFSYSIGEPCGRSNQLITYFIGSFLKEGLSRGAADVSTQLSREAEGGCGGTGGIARRRYSAGLELALEGFEEDPV